jgi:multidrug efflux pump subunit AcrB
MGVVMLTGIAVSNSILIVEFAHHLLKDGSSAKQAAVTACRRDERCTHEACATCFAGAIE